MIWQSKEQFLISIIMLAVFMNVFVDTMLSYIDMTGM